MTKPSPQVIIGGIVGAIAVALGVSIAITKDQPGRLPGTFSPQQQRGGPQFGLPNGRGQYRRPGS